MASVRDLKRDINYVLGDIIEAVYIWELTNPDKDTKKSEKIIDEAIETFDDLIEKVNAKDVENAKLLDKNQDFSLTMNHHGVTSFSWGWTIHRARRSSTRRST